MADDDRRPSLEAPRMFGRRRAKPAEPVFEDSGADVVEPAEGAVALDRLLEPDDEHADGHVDEKAADAPRRRVRRREGPPLPGPVAAALTGIVVGLTLVGLTWLGFRGCEAVRGTSSCGTGPGMVALVVILALAVVVGGLLLGLFAIPDPGATSFLGAGLTGVVCLLFLVEQLDHWSMVLVIPAVTAATFLLSWKLTTTYVAPD